MFLVLHFIFIGCCRNTSNKEQQKIPINIMAITIVDPNSFQIKMKSLKKNDFSSHEVISKVQGGYISRELEHCFGLLDAWFIFLVSRKQYW